MVALISMLMAGLILNLTTQTVFAKSGNTNPEIDKLYEDITNTKAIGLFTKLSFRNNAMSLHESFGKYHQGSRPPTLDELEQRYELMVQEIMTLVQDKDPALADEIQQKKDLLWMTMIDPESYESI